MHVHRPRNSIKVADLHKVCVRMRVCTSSVQRLSFHEANVALGHGGIYMEQEEWIDVKHVDLIDTITGYVQREHYAHSCAASQLNHNGIWTN